MSSLSALTAAVAVNDLECVLELVSQGQKVNWEPWPFEETALHIAADHGNAPMIAALLAAGGREYIDTLANGWTPLGMAARKGHADAVRTLVSAGADPNARDVDCAGEAPLGDAVQHGFEDVVMILLAAGADPHAPGWMNLTPLDHAEHLSSLQIDERRRRIANALTQASSRSRGRVEGDLRRAVDLDHAQEGPRPSDEGK